MAEKLMKYADATKKYDVVFGLETHVELSTNTKLFCPAHIEFGGEPNTELTPVSLGLPGSLPVINKTAVDYAIKLGLALHCEIAEWSQFARKNYFYPDMPRDYQISQYDKPTNGNGYLDVELEDGTACRSSARTSRTTPARTPTWVAPTAVSKVPTTRWSTTTVPVCR